MDWIHGEKTDKKSRDSITPVLLKSLQLHSFVLLLYKVDLIHEHLVKLPHLPLILEINLLGVAIISLQNSGD